MGVGVDKIVGGATSLLIGLLAGLTGAPAPVVGEGQLPIVGSYALDENELPIVGTYAKDRVCRGDGSDPADLLVKISTKAIESSMGSCSILHKKRNGKSFSMQVECNIPGNLVLLSDVIFTQRTDNALDFVDEYNTSPAVLHKCQGNE